MYEDIREEILVFFLTAFPTDHPVAYVETVVRSLLRATLSAERVQDFWAKQGKLVIQDMVQEFNRRTELASPLRYELMGDIGTKVRGRAETDEERIQAVFQEALMSISDTQFEQLSARILEWAGCTSFWATPASHDQGLDAFGLMHLDFPTPSDPEAEFPAVSMLVQAKHYSKEMLGTRHVREFVGSGVLAKHHVYSTAADKYTELDMRPLAPLVFFLVCSGEVTHPTRGLAKRAGVFLLTSPDVFLLFRRHWERSRIAVPGSVASMKRLIEQELRGILVAA